MDSKSRDTASALRLRRAATVSVSNSSVSFSPWYDQSHATSDTITPEVDSVVQEHRVAMQRLQRVDDFFKDIPCKLFQMVRGRPAAKRFLYCKPKNRHCYAF